MTTKPSHTLGGRLPLADPTTLTGAARELFNAIEATQVPWASAAGFEATTADGRLIGPYNSFLLHPEVGAKILEFTAAEKSHTTLSQRVHEVVIIAVANGGIPDDLSEHEKIAARVARELSTHHRVDNTLYREAEKAFGTTGLFDIAA